MIKQFQCFDPLSLKQCLISIIEFRFLNCHFKYFEKNLCATDQKYFYLDQKQVCNEKDGILWAQKAYFLASAYLSLVLFLE